MASSVVRMPVTDDWGDPGRLAAAVFGAAHGRTSFAASNLKKVLVRQHQRSDAASSSSSSPALNAAGNSAAGEDDGGSPVITRKRQRWAARQAQEMVTTIERQAHKAELSSGLTPASQPVSSRAASRFRQASEGPGGGAVSSSGAGDVRPNVRASSLIQMWRELEAEAGLITPRHRTASSVSNAENASAASFSADDPSGCNSDGSDESDAFRDWDMRTTASSEPANSSYSSMTTENEKGRVGSIVKMLSSGNRARTFVAPLNITETTSRRQNPAAAADKAEWLRNTGPSVLSPRRLKGRGEMENFVARMEQERRRELVALSDHQHVSRFAYRGRIQSMLKLRSLRRQLEVQDQVRTPSRRMELDQLQNGSSISYIRERFNHRGCSSRKPAVESSSNVHVQFPMNAEGSSYTSTVHVQFPINTEDSGYMSTVHVHFPLNTEDSSYANSVHVPFPMDAEGSNYEYSTDQFTNGNNQYQRASSPGESESPPPESNSLHSRCDDLQEVNNSLDGSWDERKLWASNLDWQRPPDSLPSNGWHSEVAVEELESFPQQNVSNWIGEHSNSWRGWVASRKSMYHDWFESFSDNVEIRELLERRRVTTSLASDFCDKMNRMILSLLNRQAQRSFNEDFAENHVDHPFWPRSVEYQNAEQGESVSSSLVPLQYRTYLQAENWQSASSARQSSHSNAIDTEAMQDLRSDMAQIHEEINELRMMVENCMERQSKLRQSIKEDILDALRQTGSFAAAATPSASHNFGAKQGRKGSCCICCEKQVDSLLYRCGHMCTCFNCAYQLQWSNGKCPVCRCPIVDVVRAFPNS